MPDREPGGLAGIAAGSERATCDIVGAADLGTPSEPTRFGRGRPPRRKVVAVVHMDVAGYSRLVRIDDAGTLEHIKLLREELILPQTRAYAGILAQTAGDSLLLTFPSITSAVLFALEVQRQVPDFDRTASEETRMRYRIGIDVGEIIIDRGELHGNGIVVAVRLEGVCPVEGVCVSRAIRERIPDSLGLSFEDLGALHLKNVEEPVEAFVVRAKPGSMIPWARNPASLSGPAMPSRAGRAAAILPSRADDPQRDHRGSARRGNVRNLSQRRPSPRSPDDEAPMVAVLPFDQFADDRLPSFVCDGMVADMICQLSGLRELRVISHGTTLAFRNSGADLGAISRSLGVRYLVRGGMRSSGPRLRLTTELVETDSGRVLWAGNSDFRRSRSFECQDEIVAQIVNSIAPGVREAELFRIRGKRPESLSAYEMVLLSREHLLRLDPHGFAAARKYLDRAMVEEPGYAEAYALSADWHGLKIAQGLSDDREADIAMLEDSARMALALDGSNVRASIRYGHRRSLLHRDYRTALDLFDRALRTAPNSAQAWLWSSFTFSYVGKVEEALRRAQRALQLSPHDVEAHFIHAALCIANYTAGQYEDAVTWGLQEASGKSSSRANRLFLIAAMAAGGQRQAAEPFVRRVLVEQPDFSVNRLVSRHPYQNEGRRISWGEHLIAAGLPP